MSTEENEYIAIKDFLLAVRDDIRYLVTEHLNVLIQIEFKDLTKQFYQGLEVVDLGIKTAIDRLKEVKYEYLHDHGLTGIELKRKLGIFDRARELWQEYIRGRRSFVRRFFGKGIEVGRRIAKRLLTAIDVILDSLATVIPALGAVAEFKNSLLAVI